MKLNIRYSDHVPTLLATIFICLFPKNIIEFDINYLIHPVIIRFCMGNKTIFIFRCAFSHRYKNPKVRKSCSCVRIYFSIAMFRIENTFGLCNGLRVPFKDGLN